MQYLRFHCTKYKGETYERAVNDNRVSAQVWEMRGKWKTGIVYRAACPFCYQMHNKVIAERNPSPHENRTRMNTYRKRARNA